MEKLKIGDKLVFIKSPKLSEYNYYNFAEVVRLTNTQAILSDGTRLVNEPKKAWGGDGVEYSEYGETYTRWSIQTPEIIEQATKEKELIIAHNWLSKRNFTKEEKKIIYDKFKELNIL